LTDLLGYAAERRRMTVSGETAATIGPRSDTWGGVRRRTLGIGRNQRPTAVVRVRVRSRRQL